MIFSENGKEKKETSGGDLSQGIHQSCLSEMHRSFVNVPTRDPRANNFVYTYLPSHRSSLVTLGRGHDSLKK